MAPAQVDQGVWLKIWQATLLEEIPFLQRESFVCGNHVHSKSWIPTAGEMLPVKCAVLNEYDPLAIAIWKDEEMVGRISKSFKQVTSL